MKLSDDIKETTEKYIPETILHIGTAWYANQIMLRRYDSLLGEYSKTKKELENYIFKNRSNNWRRRHGYPLRRKSFR